MLRQPKWAPTKPLNVRDSSMPINKPLITNAIFLPRSCALAKWAAIGINNCGMIDDAPIKKLAIIKMVMLGAPPANIKNSTIKAKSISINFLRSNMSASGTIKNIPTA